MQFVFLVKIGSITISGYLDTCLVEKDHLLQRKLI